MIHSITFRLLFFTIFIIGFTLSCNKKNDTVNPIFYRIQNDSVRQFYLTKTPDSIQLGDSTLVSFNTLYVDTTFPAFTFVQNPIEKHKVHEYGYKYYFNGVRNLQEFYYFTFPDSIRDEIFLHIEKDHLISFHSIPFYAFPVYDPAWDNGQTRNFDFVNCLSFFKHSEFVHNGITFPNVYEAHFSVKSNNELLTTWFCLSKGLIKLSYTFNGNTYTSVKI